MAKEYSISRASGHCCRCERGFEPQQEFMASLREESEQLQRADYCIPCWEATDPAERADRTLGVWRTRVPLPREKKRLFVGDAVLMTFFERLAEAQEEAKVAFRYVLALVLMRKKLLVYEGSQRLDDGREVWMMRIKGGSKQYRVLDPRLEEEQIQQVSEQLGEILEAEL